jgi:myo-inositol-1(or 4)-monophosphatase
MMVDQKNLEIIVRKAGALLLDYYHQSSLEVHAKGPWDLVTEADIASEKFLIDNLCTLLPHSAVWAEESGKHGTSDYCWVIDPLDGTNNFAHHIGYFCTSIALMYQNTVIQAAIYQPLLNEFFYAQKDGGAYLNGNRITVASTSAGSPIISYAYRDAHDNKNLLEKITMPVIFRHLGAAALDMAYVACGRLDGMVSVGLSWWDIAAGSLLVSEAGGTVTDFAGQELTSESGSCLATTTNLHRSLEPFLKS